jgi:hypothetical protein
MVMLKRSMHAFLPFWIIIVSVYSYLFFIRVFLFILIVIEVVLTRLLIF